MTRLEELIAAANGERPVPIYKSYFAVCMAALITANARKHAPLDADEAAAIEEALAQLDKSDPGGEQ